MNSDSLVTIRTAVLADIPAVISLERSCPVAAHWSEWQYQELLEPGAERCKKMIVIAEGKAGIVGFLVAKQIAPEWELENIVVAERARRNGLGKRLLHALIARAGESAEGSIFLEVRESNMAARRLYESSEFQESGRRRLYYRNPEEDAILYRRFVP